jgi:uncharacterized membrane protein YgcG
MTGGMLSNTHPYDGHPSVKVTPESLTHAVNRMKQQGYSSDQINKQVQKWHPDWNNFDVVSHLEGNAKQGRSTKAQVGQAEDTISGQKSGAKGFGGLAGEIAKVPKKAEAVGKFTYDVTTKPAVESAIHGPSSPQAQLARQQSKAAGVAIGKGLIHPATDLPSAIASGSPTRIGSDLGNIGLTVLPAGKAGAIFGIGRAAKKAQVAEDAVKGAELGNVAEQGLMSPEEQLRSTFKGLAVARGKQDAGYSVARGEVAKKLSGVHADENLSPLEKLSAGSSAMQGELPKVIIGGQARQMDQGALDHLMGQVFSHPGMGEFQKHRVADALNKLITEGRTPQKSELVLMQHIWGKDTIGSLKESASNWSQWKNHALSVLNIPRAIESSLDASFGLRQGLVAAFYDPKNWWKSYSHSFSYLNKYLGSGEAGYQKAIAGIHARPNFARYQAGGLAMTDLEHEVGLREEAFQSNLAEKMTIKGHGPGNLVRGSGRAYTGGAIEARANIADRLLDLAHSKGYNIDDEHFLKDTMSFVNAITGRGNLPTKILQESAPLLNGLFFSPRLLASRFQMLGQPFNVALLRRNPFIYRQYLKANARTFGTLGIILATIRQFVSGAKVNMNPRSSDFGKVKIGHTRIDLLGGFNQVFHQGGEQIAGEKISSSTGQLQSLTSGKFGQPTRFDEFLNFLKGKESPSTGLLTDYLSNKNPQHFGQKFNALDELKAKLQPLSIQDAWSLYNDPVHGIDPILAGLAGYGMSGVGIGVQTYGPRVPKTRGSSGGDGTGGLFGGGGGSSGGGGGLLSGG